MVGYSHRRVSESFGAFDGRIRRNHGVHGRHGGMQVELHPFLRRMIFPLHLFDHGKIGIVESKVNVFHFFADIVFGIAAKSNGRSVRDQLFKSAFVFR